MTEKDIRDLLEKQFSPVVLKVTDESYKHVGHPETLNSIERCFDLVIVSEHFQGKTLLERHAAIYRVLGMGKTAEIHGLTIHAQTPGEWGA